MEIITPQSIRQSKAVLEEYQFQIRGQDQPVPEEEQLVLQNAEPKSRKGKISATE